MARFTDQSSNSLQTAHAARGDQKEAKHTENADEEAQGAGKRQRRRKADDMKSIELTTSDDVTWLPTQVYTSVRNCAKLQYLVGPLADAVAFLPVRLVQNQFGAIRSFFQWCFAASLDPRLAAHESGHVTINGTTVTGSILGLLARAVVLRAAAAPGFLQKEPLASPALSTALFRHGLVGGALAAGWLCTYVRVRCIT